MASSLHKTSWHELPAPHYPDPIAGSLMNQFLFSLHDFNNNTYSNNSFKVLVVCYERDTAYSI